MENGISIACGPNVDDYHWMEVLMREAGPFFDGISLHHYALASYWEDKRPAIGFPENEWFSLIESALKMDELISKHSTIMDQYDPDKRIGLIVDEWGSWLAVEPHTNPGFLYQQNTIRDAIVASLTLNIFHRHADRIHMANIAQMVNVLQAMVLTKNEKMFKTPTYHVFDLYKNHMEAQRVDTSSILSKHTDFTVSKKENLLTISLCNYDLAAADDVIFDIRDSEIVSISAESLIGTAMDQHNSFDLPDNLTKQLFNDYILNNQNELVVTIPPMSVISLYVTLG